MKHDKIVLLGTFKFSSIEVLISKVFIDSNINSDEFVLINNVQKEFYDMTRKLKILVINKSLNYI